MIFLADAAPKAYPRQQRPAHASDMPAAFDRELRTLFGSVSDLTRFTPQVTDRVPDNPERGLVRIAVTPWDPLGIAVWPQFVMFDGAAWVGVGDILYSVLDHTHTFLDLTDTPAGYLGTGTDLLMVNVGETGVETIAQGAGGGLDADTVDGSDAADFAAAGHDHDADYSPIDHVHEEVVTDWTTIGEAQFCEIALPTIPSNILEIWVEWKDVSRNGANWCGWQLGDDDAWTTNPAPHTYTGCTQCWNTAGVNQANWDTGSHKWIWFEGYGNYVNVYYGHLSIRASGIDKTWICTISGTRMQNTAAQYRGQDGIVALDGNLEKLRCGAPAGDHFDIGGSGVYRIIYKTSTQVA